MKIEKRLNIRLFPLYLILLADQLKYKMAPKLITILMNIIDSIIHTITK